MQKKYDHLLIGFAAGAILPVVMMYTYYLFTYRSQTESFSVFLEYFSLMNMITKSVSLAVYASNLPLFFIFIWREYNQNARGVLFATIGYTLWVVFEKVSA